MLPCKFWVSLSLTSGLNSHQVIIDYMVFVFAAGKQERFLTHLARSGSSRLVKGVSPILGVPRGLSLDSDFSRRGVVEGGLITPGLVVGADGKNNNKTTSP